MATAMGRSTLLLLFILIIAITTNQVFGCCMCRRLTTFLTENVNINSSVSRQLKNILPNPLISTRRNTTDRRLCGVGIYKPPPSLSNGGKCSEDKMCKSGICRHSMCLNTRVGIGCAKGKGSEGEDCAACLDGFVLDVAKEKSANMQEYYYCRKCPNGFHIKNVKKNGRTQATCVSGNLF